EVERPRTKRIAQPARQAAGVAPVARVAADHVVGGRPARPFTLAADGGATTQGQSRAADTDAVAHRPTATHHIVETASRCIHNHSSGLVVAIIRHFAAAKLRLDLFRRKGSQRETIMWNRGIVELIGPVFGDSATGK